MAGLYARALGLAAAPTFAAMAVVTATLERGTAQMLCGGLSASPLAGMAFMYALMSAFHITPWLKLMMNSLTVSGPDD